ncbi:hypothetical protein NST50_09430 [Paenibacillus sp. FSL E2-0202]|uniref:hypothetical protein n=1 Tax=Paenibacillus sp. FSL E2-0202 TaxID=2954505 RepID=UPI0030EDEB8E
MSSQDVDSVAQSTTKSPFSSLDMDSVAQSTTKSEFSLVDVGSVAQSTTKKSPVVKPGDLVYKQQL